MNDFLEFGGKPLHYDHDGKPIGMWEWASLFELIEYRRVAETFVGDVRISTVWLGLDHGWGGGPPLIFETMIFGGGEHHNQWRYSTLEEAQVGHVHAVRLAQLDQAAMQAAIADLQNPVKPPPPATT